MSGLMLKRIQLKKKKSIITVSANGWGNLDRLDYVITTKDSTKIITKLEIKL
jgi:hypothetical protein